MKILLLLLLLLLFLFFINTDGRRVLNIVIDTCKTINDNAHRITDGATYMSDILKAFPKIVKIKKGDLSSPYPKYIFEAIPKIEEGAKALGCNYVLETTIPSMDKAVSELCTVGQKIAKPVSDDVENGVCTHYHLYWTGLFEKVQKTYCDTDETWVSKKAHAILVERYKKDACYVYSALVLFVIGLYTLLHYLANHRP